MTSSASAAMASGMAAAISAAAKSGWHRRHQQGKIKKERKKTQKASAKISGAWRQRNSRSVISAYQLMAIIARNEKLKRKAVLAQQSATSAAWRRIVISINISIISSMAKKIVIAAACCQANGKQYQ